MAFDLLGKVFARFRVVAVKMYGQHVRTRLILFNTNTRHARLIEQACRVAMLQFANFFFGGDFILLPPVLEG